ncbi:LysR substrate-binding domain-containing protein [Bdellovibrio sp. HCB2-146]|uniref:LysR family transcriptional regulator n=1 Tax=Bdellovibrio sp. HCB2-146 TaxID=3394362 RepID=UPI0039BD193C
MEQLDLNQIRTFIKIVQAGSFTKAAEVLRQPKSRVSRRMAALEKELGVQLIYRTTRQFQLTEIGRQFFERGRNLIEGLESLSSEISETTSEVSGLIRITASDDMGILYLPALLDEFCQVYPQVRFEILLTQSYVDLVKESVDVALRIGALKDSSLKVRKIGNVKSIFVASPGFLERYRQIEDLSMIHQWPFLSLKQQEKLDVYRDSDSKKITLKVKPTFSSNNPSMLVPLAVRGRGLGFVPEFLCREHIRSGRLVHVLKNLRSDEVPISLVTPDQKEVPLKVRKFIEFAAKRLKELF